MSSINYSFIMPKPYFTFKQFTVRHDRCAMKVGTDGVLLGAWADLENARRVLDIGTGTGLIALMLAQRCSGASITGIDIDADAVSQAKENVWASPWKDRIGVCLQDVCSYADEGLFDVIVSNPPYFVDSLKCPDGQRTIARHTDTLDAGRLLGKASELLFPEGRFSLILPADQIGELVRMAEEKGLYPSRLTWVITRPGLSPKRALVEFRKERRDCLEDELLVELERHVYSEDYIALTKDFYLKM